MLDHQSKIARFAAACILTPTTVYGKSIKRNTGQKKLTSCILGLANVQKMPQKRNTLTRKSKSMSIYINANSILFSIKSSSDKILTQMRNWRKRKKRWWRFKRISWLRTKKIQTFCKNHFKGISSQHPKTNGAVVRDIYSTTSRTSSLL